MRLYLLTALMIALVPGVSLAQSLGGLGDTKSSFTLSTTPEFPTPYSNVVLSFLSSSLDLTNATLSVSVGGKNVYKGTVRPVSVTLGRAGSIVPVSATIVTGGTSYSQTRSLQPQDVAMVAEPISSVPPLYKGKALVPLEGTVRVVAVASLKNANGSALDPATLSYAWTVDDTHIQNSSGIGKTALILASPLQYRARDVSVVVMSQDRSLIGGASLSLTSMEPSVRIYENDPLLGIRFERALVGGHTIDTESMLYAAPFSLSTTGGAPLIQWFLNGTAAQTGNSITLRPTGSGQGNASLSLVASSGNNTTATANLSLSFGGKSGTNFFGI